MLLRFSVENFLSFDSEVSLSMMATADSKHPTHVIETKSTTSLKQKRVLRGAAIYGANGHGKTNLVHALQFVSNLVIEGVDIDRQLAVRKFKSHFSDPDRPATFIFNIVTRGVEYEYGLKVHRTHIAEEWLFASPKGREIVLFERITKPELGSESFKTTIEYGATLLKSASRDHKIKKDFLEFVALGTRPNQPFITEAIERNVEALKPIYNWFKNELNVIGAEGEYASLEIKAHEDASFIKRLSDAVHSSGIGIDHIETEIRPVDIEDFRDLPKEILNDIKDRLEPGKLVVLGSKDSNRRMLRKNDAGDLELIDLVFIHKRKDGSTERFNQEEESSGTRRLIHLLPILFNLANSDKTFIIDELDRKLHPLLSYNLMQNFLAGSPCGQLIFTTHNTHLLDLELIRRDEVWFIEKDVNGHSDLYSLTDLKVRPDVEIKKGYLNGRFGAVPFLGNTGDLGWSLETDGKNNKTTKTPTESRSGSE